MVITNTTESTICPTTTQLTSKQHVFIPARTVETTEAISKTKCNICLDDIGTEQKISQLTCNHRYHYECIENYLSQVDSCPNCREHIENVTEHENSEALYQANLVKVPQKCDHDNCHLWVNNKEITIQEATCPYPISSFIANKQDDFIQSNEQHLVIFLYEQFSKKGINVRVEVINNTLELKINHKKLTGQYHYTNDDVNANTMEECFNLFIYKLRVDTMFFFLKTMYPNIFAIYSDVHISSYSCKENTLSIKIDDNKQNINLNEVLQPQDKKLIWSNLRNSLGADNYKKLFEQAPKKYTETAYEDVLRSREEIQINDIFSLSFGGLHNDGTATHSVGFGYREPRDNRFFSGDLLSTATSSPEQMESSIQIDGMPVCARSIYNNIDSSGVRQTTTQEEAIMLPEAETEDFFDLIP